MNKTYEVSWSEKKTTTTGKPVISATLKDETGATFDKVSIWGDFPNFANIMTGHRVTGNLYTNDKGYKTLYPPKPEQNRASGGQNFGAKMMEKKAEYIEKAQERKSESIAYFNAVNSAIGMAGLYVKQLGMEPPRTEMKEFVIKWRDWFLSEWERYNSPPKSPVDIDKEPF